MKKDIFDEQSGTTTQPRGGETPGTSRAPFDKEAMMERAREAGTPGAGHEALKAFEGDWNAEVKCWMDPNGPSETSHATASAHWILGGRFLEEQFQGQVMGKPFNGRGLFGFDNTKEKFIGIWMDDMNTAIFTSEGTGENGNKTITLEGKSNCPATGQRDVPMRQVYRVIDHDKHVLEMFNDGRKSMEITYTRQ